MRLKSLENKKGQTTYNKRFNMLLKRLNKTAVAFEQKAINASPSTGDYDLSFERASKKIESILEDLNHVMKALNESTYLKKGGYETVSFYAVKNAVEKFIRKTYSSDGGRALRTLDDVSKSIEQDINSSVYSLERLEKKYDNSMYQWVEANEDRIRDLVYRNL